MATRRVYRFYTIEGEIIWIRKGSDTSLDIGDNGLNYSKKTERPIYDSNVIKTIADLRGWLVNQNDGRI